MVSFRKSRTIHSVGGVRGLAVRIEGAEQTKRALAGLPAAVQRKVLRGAVAAAARPVTKTMRRLAKSYSAASKQQEGIGATARAIAQKVRTSKRDPATAYAVIGARRDHVELVDIKHSTGAVAGITQVRRRNKKGAVRRRNLKNLGPIARKARLNPRRENNRKRRPSRYLHLIEKGGKKRATRAGHFMSRAAAQQSGQVRKIFADKLDEGIAREFKKLAAT